MSTKSTGNPPRILLIEDNEGYVRLFQVAVKEGHLECRIEVISDGDRALERIEGLQPGEQDCPDLIVLDLNLPGTDGRAILSKLRTDVRLRGLPVVVLTATINGREASDLSHRYGVDVLRKPIDIPDLIEIGRKFGLRWSSLCESPPLFEGRPARVLRRSHSSAPLGA